MKALTTILLVAALPAAAALAAADIEVRKTVNNEFPMANEPVEFIVEVNNIGDEPAAGVSVTDILPAEMVIPAGTAAFPGTGTYDPATGEWAIGDLDPGSGAVLTIPAVVTETMVPGCIVNTAKSGFDDGFLDDNDEARAAIHQPGVERCVDLAASIGVSASSPFEVFPSCDSKDRYQGDVELVNDGPDAARDVVVTLAQDPVVGPNLRFDDPDCADAPAAQCRIPEIAAGETVRIDVTSDLYQSHSEFSQTIFVSVTSSDLDYDLSNNDLSASGTAGGFSSCEVPDLGIGDVFVGPGCFIATAAYGSPLHRHLDSLRDFRDEYLLTNAPGRAFVSLYYRYSPPVADFIAERDWLRAVVRAFLFPLVIAIEHPHWLASLLFGLGLVAIWRRRSNGGFHPNG